MNTECDYSSAYVVLKTDSDLTGFGMTFTIGRGNEIVRLIFHVLLALLPRTHLKHFDRSAMRSNSSHSGSSGKTPRSCLVIWVPPGRS